MEILIRKKMVGVDGKRNYHFAMPNGPLMIVMVVMLITSLIIPMIGRAPKKTVETMIKQLNHSLPLFDLDEMNLEDMYYYSQLADNLKVSIKLPDLELQDLNIKEQPLNNLYYLTMLADKYDLDMDDLVGETQKFFKDYAFIDDLEMEEEKLEADTDNEETVVYKAKPQTVEACYYAMEVMRKTGELAAFKKTKEYRMMINFILKMQAASGIIYNNKNTETDLRVMDLAILMLEEAKNDGIEVKAINSLFERSKTVYEAGMNLDGSYDFYLQDSPSCLGTAYGVYGRKILGMSVKDTTQQYLLSCVSDKGASLFKDEEHPDIETSYIIEKTMRDARVTIGGSNSVVYTISCLFITAALVLLVSSTVEEKVLAEIVISVIIFAVGSIVAYYFSTKTLEVFFLVPTLALFYKSYQRIQAWKKDALIYLIVFTPATLVGCLVYLIDTFFPDSFVSMTGSYLVWIALAAIIYFDNVFYPSIIAEKHTSAWFLDASQIAFHLAYITIAIMFGAGDSFGFTMSNMQLAGSTIYYLVGVPCVGYILSLIASILSIPAVSVMVQKKEK